MIQVMLREPISKSVNLIVFLWNLRTQDIDPPPSQQQRRDRLPTKLTHLSMNPTSHLSTDERITDNKPKAGTRNSLEHPFLFAVQVYHNYNDRLIVLILFPLFEFSDNQPSCTENKEEAIQCNPPCLQTIINALHYQKKCKKGSESIKEIGQFLLFHNPLIFLYS